MPKQTSQTGTEINGGQQAAERNNSTLPGEINDYIFPFTAGLISLFLLIRKAQHLIADNIQAQLDIG